MSLDVNIDAVGPVEPVAQGLKLRGLGQMRFLDGTVTSMCEQ